MPKISIIIPVYNAEKEIERCLESILANTFQDLEIILINDGSQDSSQKILEEYVAKFPQKIRVFTRENRGVARTRNEGLLLARGKYAMFVDNDDYVDHDYLEKFLSKIEESEADVVMGGYRRTTEQKVLFEMNLQQAEWSKYIVMAPWAKIYRREFLLDNKIEFLNNNIGEDVYFNLQVVNLTDKISIINYIGYNWFFNEKSVSNTKQKTLREPLNVMRLLDSCYDALRNIGAINKSEVEFYFIRYIIWYLLFSGKRSRYGLINAELEKTFNWIKEKYPDFLRNKNISLKYPEGETLRNRMVVYFFILTYRLGIIKFLLYCYSDHQFSLNKEK